MTLTNISLDQHQLLTKIGQYTEANRRTDRLAECMKQFGGHWKTDHTAFIGLQLRSFGWVTTHKDQGQYARWDITPLGKAVILELRNMGRTPNSPPQKEAPVTIPRTTKVSEWLVVGPEGEVSVAQADHKKAGELAEKWAKEEPGKSYKVVAVLETYKATVVIDKV